MNIEPLNASPTAEKDGLLHYTHIAHTLARCLETGRDHDAALNHVHKAWQERTVPAEIEHIVAMTLIWHDDGIITAEDAVEKMHTLFSNYTTTSKEQG